MYLHVCKYTFILICTSSYISNGTHNLHVAGKSLSSKSSSHPPCYIRTGCLGHAHITTDAFSWSKQYSGIFIPNNEPNYISPLLFYGTASWN